MENRVPSNKRGKKKQKAAKNRSSGNGGNSGAQRKLRIQAENAVNENITPAAAVPVDLEAEERRRRDADLVEMTLERIRGLQVELAAHAIQDESESDDNDDVEFKEAVMKFDALKEVSRSNIDAKTLGFIACAQETMKYLEKQGIPKDNPMVVSLRNRLIEGINRI